MKIALLGSSSTGKTTLSSALSKELALPLIREQARVVLAVLGKTLKELRSKPEEILNFQKMVLEYQIASELECAESGFVSDRSVFDNLTLYLRHCPLIPNEVDNYRSIVFKHYESHPYDFLIFLRPGEFPMEEDGVRTPDPIYQSQIDGMMLAILRLFSIPYFEVHGTLPERVAEIKRLIEEYRPGWLERHLSKK